jgi:hypothetical protein
MALYSSVLQIYVYSSVIIGSYLQSYSITVLLFICQDPNKQ